MADANDPVRRQALGDLLAMLADPNAVHLNLAAGTIARPTWAQIMHAYPVESAAAVAAAREEGRREAFEKAAHKASLFGTGRDGIRAAKIIEAEIRALAQGGEP